MIIELIKKEDVRGKGSDERRKEERKYHRKNDRDGASQS